MPHVERDNVGRACWAIAVPLVTCGEDGEPNVPLVDALVEHGLWVLRDRNEVLVTWEAI